MALPTIAINSGTGSNTAASGAGPVTALSGTGAATATSTIVTLITDNPDLSGVAVDGSAVIWVGSSSGQQFAKITGVNNVSKTVTVATAFVNTESGKNWGIGGKRASWAGSSQLNADVQAGWIVDIQTGETITADLTITPASSSLLLPIIFKSTTFITWGTQPIIQTAIAGVAGLNINGNNIIIEGLYFKCTVVTPTEGNSGIVSKFTHPSNISIINCIFDGWYYGINNNNGTFNGIHQLQVNQCEIKNSTHQGLSLGYELVSIFGCYIHDNTLTGITDGNIIVSHCVIANNGEAGIYGSAGSVINVDHCTITNNGTSVDSSGGGINGSANTITIIARNTIFYNNNGSSHTNGGIVGSGLYQLSIINCAFGGSNQVVQVGNSGDATERIAQIAAIGTITLTTSPFVSSSDYGLNSTPGGGPLCKSSGTIVPNTSVNTGPDIGAVQSGASGGGGKLVGYGGGLAA